MEISVSMLEFKKMQEFLTGADKVIMYEYYYLIENEDEEMEHDENSLFFYNYSFDYMSKNNVDFEKIIISFVEIKNGEVLVCWHFDNEDDEDFLLDFNETVKLPTLTIVENGIIVDKRTL